MSDHIEKEELSAFIDGEARNASKVRLHIEMCEECTAHLDALRSLQGSVQKLDEPDVHPAFATRVRATIEERALEPAPASWYRFGSTLFGIAALTLLTVSLFSERPASIDTNTPDNSLAIAEAEWKSILEQDESDLAERLETKLAREWVDGAMVVAPYEVAESESTEIDTAMLSLALRDAEPELVRTDLIIEGADSQTEITRMTPKQSELFKQMLVMHAREEILGDAALEV